MDNLEQKLSVNNHNRRDLHLRNKRNFKGAAPPVQIPILLFIYTLIFLIMVEFVMLFWIQSSLDIAANQVALKAATNPNVPLDQADAVQQRCKAAAQEVGQIFPGYSLRVRSDYVNAVVNGNKTAALNNFDEIAEEGGLRTKLIALGAKRPAYFWGGSPRGGPGNMHYGGCYALRNPITNNIVFHSVVHCGGCWPIFLKGFYMDQNRSTNLNATGNQRVFSLSGWLEGRGSFPATQAGGGDKVNLNKSLISSGPRPVIACNDDTCDVDGGGDQNKVFPQALSGGTAVCPAFEGQVAQSVKESRPASNQVSMGTGEKVFAIEQWPTSRGSTCTRCAKCSVSYNTTQTSDGNCKGADSNPSGVFRFANCGDIDPLILVGIRYACRGVDGFGRIIKTAGGTNGTGGETSADYLGRCDHFFAFKPSCAQTFVPMDKTVGDVTDLNEQNGPCIIRREEVSTSETRLVCRNDSKEVKPWLGPYSGGPASAVAEYKAATKTFSLDSLAGTSTSTSSLLSGGNLDGPLDNAIPYHAVCDICNPGSPKCGMYGTCRDKSNLWPSNNDGGTVALHSQLWSNTPFWGLNPYFNQLKCRYRRDCQERHCCWSALEDGTLKPYCQARQIEGGNVRYGRACCTCGTGCCPRINKWTYHGVPNEQPATWTPNSLPRQGKFPHCSSGAVKMLGDQVGECCAPDVLKAELPCGPEPAPPVRLTPPNPCSATRECEGGRINSKFCPGTPPQTTGNCIEGNYPIGGSASGGGGGMGGTGPGVPKGAGVSAGMCSPPPCKPGSPGCSNPNPRCGLNNTQEKTSTETQGNTTVTTKCTTKTMCECTPLVISLDDVTEPQFAESKVCFQLDGSRYGAVYRWLKGNNRQGFIAMDFNRNGKIDDGMELFGNLTQDRYYPNGYVALASLKDLNRDGLISGRELNGLLIWFDLNEDGVSQANELKTIQSQGVVELDVAINQINNSYNTMLLPDGSVYTKDFSKLGYKVKDKKGHIKTGYTWDLILVGSPNETCAAKQKMDFRIKEARYSINHFWNAFVSNLSKPFKKHS